MNSPNRDVERQSRSSRRCLCKSRIPSPVRRISPDRSQVRSHGLLETPGTSRLFKPEESSTLSAPLSERTGTKNFPPSPTRKLVTAGGQDSSEAPISAVRKTAQATYRSQPYRSRESKSSSRHPCAICSRPSSPRSKAVKLIPAQASPYAPYQSFCRKECPRSVENSVCDLPNCPANAGRLSGREVSGLAAFCVFGRPLSEKTKHWLLMLERTVLTIVGPMFLCGILALVLFWVCSLHHGFYWRFNNHPVFMVAGLITSSGLAILSFQICFCCSKKGILVTHIVLQFMAMIFASIGMSAAHSYRVNNPNRAVPGYTSVHSWIGLATFIMFLLQMVGGIVLLCFYCCYCCCEQYRRRVAIFHLSFGIFTFVMAAGSVLNGLAVRQIYTFPEVRNCEELSPLVGLGYVSSYSTIDDAVTQSILELERVQRDRSFGAKKLYAKREHHPAQNITSSNIHRVAYEPLLMNIMVVVLVVCSIIVIWAGVRMLVFQ